MSRYAQFYAIINKIGYSKQEIILDFTDGRTDSLSALSDPEFKSLMNTLEKFNKIPPGDQMRKKMIGIARSMNWGKSAKEIIPKIDAWCVKQKYQLPLMQLDVPQLTLMLTIFDQKVYVDYLRSLNK